MLSHLRHAKTAKLQKLQWPPPHTINFDGFSGARFSGSDSRVVPCAGDLTGKLLSEQENFALYPLKKKKNPDIFSQI